MSKVVKTKVGHDLKQSINNAVNELGGFRRFISKGEELLLKVNFNTADPFPASSDIEFIRAVVELTYEAGASSVMVADSCTFSQSTQQVMEEKRVFELEKMDPAPVILNLDEQEWVKKEIPGAKYLESIDVPEILDTVDKLILLPCLKTHSWAQFTGALKLSVGFMKSSQRMRLHMRKLQEKVAELNLVIKPDLIIMDARKCFITKGPSQGEVREPGVVLAGTGRVAIDVEGIQIIQGYEGNSLADIDAGEIVQIKYALDLGIA